ncbi:MAG: Uma2 family endonuclease [Candidatus Poribacteria bacterium]|nr:Uma2 family endonuclease [Candidatus Poribacteria bacterium]
MKQWEIHEVEQGIRPPESIKMTLEEFLEYDVEGYEYVNGELVPMAPPSREHGAISVNVIRYLDAHVYQHKLGRLYTAETTFQVGERTAKPDVAFVSTARLTGDKTKGFSIPPDLAIEVVSPSDVQSRIAEKALAYLNAGTRLVWVLEPVTKTVTVYRSETDIKMLTHKDTLTGEDIVPGFSCAVAQLFE